MTVTSSNLGPLNGGINFARADRDVQRRASLEPQTAKPPGCDTPAALPCPPYVPFSWTVIVGLSKPGSEANAADASLFVPFSAAGGDDPSPTRAA